MTNRSIGGVSASAANDANYLEVWMLESASHVLFQRRRPLMVAAVGLRRSAMVGGQVGAQLVAMEESHRRVTSRHLCQGPSTCRVVSQFHLTGVRDPRGRDGSASEE